MKVFFLPVICTLLSSMGFAHAAAPTALQWHPQSKTTLVLPQTATLAEQTAALELDDYLTKATGGDFIIQSENGAAKAASPAVYIGATQFARQSGIDPATLASEEWHIKTQNGNLILVGGGTRGTLYATYRFLEDVVGVRWWNPWEETVPAQKPITLPPLDKRGKPVFGYRDIFMLYGNDNGRFAIRNRLNRDGDSPIGAKYGGSRNYGPPYHVHTFYKILSPQKYAGDHPDWFIVPKGGTPTSENSQLAMSNPAMRREFLKLLRELIRKSHHEAREKGLPEPDVFSVSQEDNRVSFATPGDAALLAQNDGAESAILLDFVNYLADGIKDEFPHVFIDTLAYFSGEKAPANIRPRENVVIRLTDTTSNLILPMTHPRNHEFHDNVVAWGKITKNLRVWDYAVTFKYPGLPMPTAHTYSTDYRFLKANNVEGIFTEHEFPILADMRDFKIWVQCKLLEDPNRDYEALVREFTDGFYGPAGVHVRRYIHALQNEAVKVGEAQGYEDISWFAPPRLYNYLPLEFLIRANAMFDEAARAAGDDEILQRRVRHARMPLDRFITLFHDALIKRWSRSGQEAVFPLDREAISARYLKSWNEQIDLRLPEKARAAERILAADEIKKLTLGSLYNDKVPEKFQGFSSSEITVYGPRDMNHYAGLAKVVADKESELGEVSRYEIPGSELKKYQLPMQWGIYDTISKKTLLTNSIQAAQVPGAGYHWYRLNDVKLPSNAYLYFFWSWIIQLDLNRDYDEENPNQQFEIWANIKFEGPAFPHGKATDKNAISVERVVLVKK